MAGTPVATLSGDFEITTAGGVAELGKLRGAMDQTETKVLGSANKIERAIAQAVDAAAPVAGLKQISSAIGETSATAQREFNRIERAGESLSASLDRQINAFGKTTQELRAMKVETAALAAEQAGMAELAGRLRQQEADLYAMEFAAARQARLEEEALAQDRAAAAEAAARQAALDIAARRNAAAAYQAFEERVRAGVAAMEAQAQAENEAAGTAQRVRAALDPVAAVQERYTALLNAARIAKDADKLSTEELAQYEALLAKESDAVVAAMKRVGGASNQARFSGMMLGQQFSDIGAQAAAGTNPMIIFAQQSGQVAFALQGMEGKLGKVGAFLSNPWVAAGLAAASVVAVLSSKMHDNGSAADDMARHQHDLGDIIDQTTGKIKEQSQALLLNQAIQTGKDVKKAQDAANEARQAIINQGWSGSFVSGVQGASALKVTTDPRIAAAIAAFGKNGDASSLASTMKSISDASPGLKSVTDHVIELSAAWTKADRQVQQYNAQVRLETGQGRPGDNRTALGQFGPPKVDLSIVDAEAKVAAAVTKTQKAEAQADLIRAKARQGYNDLGKSVDWYRDQMAQADRLQNTATQHVDHHAQSLARAHDATEAQTANLFRLADAYKASGASALVAEATLRAQSQAIKAGDDQTAAVERQVRLAIAQRVADSEKATAAMNDQSAVQERVNAAVEAGLIPQSKAADAARDQLQLLPLIAAVQVAQQRGYKEAIEKATKALDDQKAAQERAANDNAHSAFLGADADADRQLATLHEEIRLIGAADAARVHALATLRATQEAQRLNLDPADAEAYIEKQVKIADLGAELSSRQDDYNDRLSFTADLWDLIGRNVDNAARGMEDAFGGAGRAIGGLAATYTSYRATQARLDQQHDAAIHKAYGDQAATERENARYAVENATAQIGLFGDMAEAAQGFFKKGSTGYKILGDAEKAYRAIELAMAIKNAAEQIGLIGARTAATVAGNAAMAASDTVRAGVEQGNSIATTAVKAVEAVVNAIRSMPFPLNLAAGAATAGAIAALGVAIVGGFGGGHNNLPAANEGKGTVFGDSDAKSDSIKRAIDTLHDVDLSINRYSGEMAASLKSIDNQIGGLANLVVRIGGTDGINASGGVQTGFKSNLIGNVAGSTLGGAALGFGAASAAISTFGTFTALGAAGGPIGLAAGAIVGAVLAPVIKSLFGTKTSVVGSGIYGAPQTLGDVLAGGYDAQYYSDIQKKKKFFGLTTSTKYTTQYGAADPALEQQFALILKSFDDAILAAAGPLGAATDDISNRLNSFVVNIGKIDTKGLTGQEIQDKLQAVFGAAADSMAQAAIPGLEKFEQVGEGYFETLIRVASTVEQVTTDLDLLGRSTAQLGIDAKMGLASQFDSISDLNSAVSTYFQDFYTDAEQSAAKAAQLGKVFDALGVQMPSTLAGFRQLVDGQDLTTAAGQQMYATLLQLAPAFASVATAGQSATDAASILRERQDLERQLAEAEGDTARVRELELAAIDPSNRAIQQLIYARQDEAAAAQVAAQQAEQRASLQQQIWQLQGNTDAIRAAQLDAITDPVAKAMQQQIFSLQDQQAAAQAAQQAADEAAQKADQLRQAWESTGDSIEDEIKRIRGLSDTDGAVSFAKQQADFDAAVQLAMGGNQDAAKSLPGLSKTLLDTASAVASSRQELDRIQATTAAALQTVADKIGSITTAALGPTAAANDNFDQNWWAEFASKATTTPAATANSRSMADLRDALDELAAKQEQTKAELVNALAQIAATNQKMADILARAEKLGQGDGLAVATVTEREAA